MGLLSWLFGTPKPVRRKRRRSQEWVEPEVDIPTNVNVVELTGPELYGIDVVGEAHYQQEIELICGGRTENSQRLVVLATLVHEDENPHDPKAIRVDIDGRTVGYLSRENARQYRRQLVKSGFAGMPARCSALTVGGWDRGVNDRGFFGVKVDLPTAD